MSDNKKEWVERVKKELNEFVIGDYDLDQVFEPLLEVCSKLANTYDEFKQCISEGVTTLKSVLSKIRF